MPIRLIKPSLSHEAAYKAMIQEFSDKEERIVPRAMEPIDNEPYTQLLERLDQQEKGTYKPEKYTPASLYFIIEETTGKIIGAIHIRHSLNNFLRKYGGHISYGIRPSERKKHYGSDALKQACEICKGKGIYEILLDCRTDNIGSAKVIQNNGGILQHTYVYKKIPRERRIITLK